MKIDYLDYLPERFQEAALDLLLKQLHEKFVPILGNDDKARNVLRTYMNMEQCTTAICDEKLMGILAIQSDNIGFINPGIDQMIHNYGLYGGLFRTAGLLSLCHKTNPEQLHVDGIAVAKKMQGKGVGSKLLGALEKRALRENKTTLTLEVINTNPRAEQLYERLGFIVISRKSCWPLNKIFKLPFKGFTIMKKNVGENHG